MANLSRKTAKIFGETATTTGNDPEIGQFGSAKAGTYVGTNDIDTIQALPAWSNGWVDAVTPTQQFPPLPEMTAVHHVMSYQSAYMLQKGIPEWDSGTTYYIGDFCKGVGEGKLYVSKVDSNINHAVTDSDYWEEFSSGGNSRNIGEIVPSTMPLTDAGLHLLDGALLAYGSYQAFIDYIAGLYDSGDYTAIFDTEANWQATVTLTGICSKFVYDSVNNTVRLPKWGTQAFTKGSSIDTASTVNVKGNGKTLGLYDGTNYFGLVSSATYIMQGYGAQYNKNVGTTPSGSSYALSKSLGVTNESTKSGLVVDTTTLSSSLTNYPLDCYYYIVIATSTKTDIQVDIDEIATDLNGKADTDLTNINSSCAPIDGQWINSSVNLLNSGTFAGGSASQTFSLSSYLPNDNYNYEVIGYAWGNTGSTSGDYVNFFVESSLMDSLSIGTARTRTTSTIRWGGCFIIPVGTNRDLIFVDTGNGCTATISLKGYRRIGTNT